MRLASLRLGNAVDGRISATGNYATGAIREVT
jgi:hypothetical protein